MSPAYNPKVLDMGQLDTAYVLYHGGAQSRYNTVLDMMFAGAPADLVNELLDSHQIPSTHLKLPRRA